MSKNRLDEEIRFAEAVRINGSPRPRETTMRVIPASEFTLHEEFSPVEKPNEVKVTVEDVVECQSLEQPSLIVKVQVEYLAGDRALVFRVPIAPGDRQAQVMERLGPKLPHGAKVELWSYPNQAALCKDANIYDLVVRHGQRLQLRRRRWFWERLRHEAHDAVILQTPETGSNYRGRDGCACHPRQ